ncbi:ABC transporter ATP-binding protein [Oceanirhabdus seepicola]|uniref:ABC transporter ATP-binding protein n=1 Tax=Oceanirhabdus seepicola TaxID=2828781 RepID=A0A9J6PAT4_9CLOT|nr:ABC transporter ATP-binding protein [Oceanirhabdus seepicola]MCM1992421.1 ABC transporter ATP-binding protein [Oceanirhabdus seepicola]
MRSFVLETKNLLKKYKEQTVINQVNIHLRPGRIYGLLGRNGAGKTTIMKMILGLTSITSGEISVFGQNLLGNEKNIYPRIGSLIERPGFYPNLTGEENLKVFSKLRGTISKDAVKKALDAVGLPYNDKKPFSQYSLGMKQRLGIANAIMNDPELLILDEPSNGLDPIGIASIRDFVRTLSRQGKTILISSHNLSEIALMADDIGIIHKGILLEESSYMELEKKNRKYIFLCVSSSSEAIRILEQQFGISDYLIDSDRTIRIYETDRNPAELNYALTTNNIDVSALQVCNDSLEDYFKKITGGEGIA